MTENKYPDYQDDHDLAPLCCIFIVAVVLLMLGIVPNTNTVADPCTLQSHELMVIDRGVDNLVLEVPRDYCDYKKTPAENIALWRNIAPSRVRVNRQETGWQGKETLVIRGEERYYTDKKIYEYVHVRGKNNSMILSTGKLAISGDGNVYCGTVDLEIEIVGNNNTVYRVVSC